MIEPENMARGPNIYEKINFFGENQIKIGIKFTKTYKEFFENFGGAT